MLEQGFGDRATDIQVSEEEGIFIVINLNHDVAERLVDRGPSLLIEGAEQSPETQVFKQIWDSKAEIRRFRDGNVAYAVSWEGSARELIPQRILEYLIQAHFSPEIASQLIIYNSDFESLKLFPNKYSSVYGQSLLSCLDDFRSFRTAFGKLEKSILGLPNMALNIVSVLAADPHLYYCALDPNEPVKVYLRFESSAKWPTQMRPFRLVKLALLLDIRKKLSGSQFGMLPECQEGFVEILVDSVEFRVFIYPEREFNVIARGLSDEKTTIEEKNILREDLGFFKTSEYEVRHSNLMHSMCLRYPKLSSAILLFKRWLGSQMLLSHIPDQIIDLLCLKSTQKYYGKMKPVSSKRIFFTTVYYLSKFDWRKNACIINHDDPTEEFNNTTFNLSATQVFEQIRKTDPTFIHHALFIASPYDPTGNAWTRNKPHKTVLARLTSLCRNAIKLVNLQNTTLTSTIMNPTVTDYQFKIPLNHPLNTVQAKLTKLFIEEIILKYEEIFLIFYDEYNLSIIYGIWKPSFSNKKKQNSTLKHIKALGGDLLRNTD